MVCWQQVSKQDKVLGPALERFFAARMKAVETLELKAGHLSLLTHPKAVAGLIQRAAAGIIPSR